MRPPEDSMRWCSSSDRSRMPTWTSRSILVPRRTLSMTDACEWSNPSYWGRRSACASKCNTPSAGNFSACATMAPKEMLWSPPTVPTIFPCASHSAQVFFTQSFTCREIGFTSFGSREAAFQNAGSGSIAMPASYGFPVSRSQRSTCLLARRIAAGPCDVPSPEDQLVLQRVLPPGQLGHRHLVSLALQRQRADDVGQVRAHLAAVDGVAPEQWPGLRRSVPVLLELCGHLRLAAGDRRDVIRVVPERQQQRIVGRGVAGVQREDHVHAR